MILHNHTRSNTYNSGITSVLDPVFAGNIIYNKMQNTAIHMYLDVLLSVACK